MPAAINEMLPTYWHTGGDAFPTVTDQTLATNEDTPLGGAVGAVDHDENIVSYAVDAAPQRGSVALNAATGTWTYTPDQNLWGGDSFRILVTDASDRTTVQNVAVGVTSVNDAPESIAVRNRFMKRCGSSSESGRR